MNAMSKSSRAWIFTGDRGAYHYDTAIYDTAATEAQLLRVVAVQLARINRYLGATLCAWPVAAHALGVSKIVEALGGSPLQALKGLHHDDHEMLTADLPGPLRSWIKSAVAQGKLDSAADWYEHACTEAQQALQAAIGLGGDPEVTGDDHGDALVRRADALALEAERRLMHYEGPLCNWGVPGLSDTEILVAVTCVRGAMVIGLPVATRDRVNEVLYWRGIEHDGEAAIPAAFAYEHADDQHLLAGPCVAEIVDAYLARDRELRTRAGLAEL